MPERAQRWRAASDPLLGAAIAVLAVAGAAGALHRPGPWAATIGAAVVLAAGIGGRRARPLAALLIAAGGLITGCLLGGHAADSDAAWLAAALLVYTAAAHRPLTPAAVGLVVMIAVATACETVQGSFDPAPPIVLLVPPFACGRALRHWRLLNVALADTATALAAGREAHAALAVADERARIARELHDVVGHAVSLIVVQATGGRRVAGERPGDAWAALGAIDLAAAQAGEELARLAAVVDAEPATLQALIAPAVAAGLSVTVRGSLPADRAGLAIRVIQEALTNALKHAGPTGVEIDIDESAESLAIRIADAGPAPGGRPAAAIAPGGYGLIGMRERVAAAGGTLSAGPRVRGGWEVLADVPRTPRGQGAANSAGDASSAVAGVSATGQPTARVYM